MSSRMFAPGILWSVQVEENETLALSSIRPVVAILSSSIVTDYYYYSTFHPSTLTSSDEGMKKTEPHVVQTDKKNGRERIFLFPKHTISMVYIQTTGISPSFPLRILLTAG